MAFTKVVGAGIHTLSNITSHNINSSGIITATKFVGPFDGSSGDFSGDVIITGDLTVNGTTTTLDTNLTEVDKVEVAANNSTVGVAITQSGSGDIINLFDGSTEVLTVTDGGNVGIGSAIPASLLNLASSNPLIRLTDTDSGSYSTIGGDGGNLYLYTNSTGRDFIFRGTSEIARITGDGTLGIGTHTPASIFHLNSSSTAEVKLTLQNTGGTTAIYGNNDDIIMDADKYRIRNNDGSTEYIRIDSNGLIANNNRAPSSYGSPNLLISGTDSTFTLMGDGSTNSTSYTGIKFRVAGASTGDYTKAGIFSRREGGYNDLSLIFALDTVADATSVSIADEKMRITSAGKVGIGTDNPAKKLEVFDATQGVMRIRGGGGGSDTSRKADLSLFASGAREYVVRADASDAAFKIIDVSDSNAERLRIGSEGNLALGGTNTSAYANQAHLFIGGVGNLYGDNGIGSGRSLSLSNNAYLNTSGNWVYRASDKASNIFQYDGEIGFRIAGTGSAGNTISWSTALRITSGGLLQATSGQHDGGLELLSGNNNQSTRLKIQSKSSGGTAYNWYLDSARSADRFTIHDGTTSWFTILGSGNIGINHLQPSAGLHIKRQGRNFSLGQFYDGYNSDNGLGGDSNSIVGSQAGERTHSLILESNTTRGKDIGSSIGFRAASGDTLIDVTYAAIVGAKENDTYNSDPNTSYDEQAKGYLAFYTSNQYAFSPHYGTQNIERLRITSDGQLGLSVTPDTWSTGKGLTIGTSQATLWGTGDQINLSGNAYFNGGWKAAETKAGASQIQQALGNIDFKVSGSVTADNAITWIDAVRIGSNGSVGIGTDHLSGNNSVYHKLMVEGDTTSQIAVARIVRKNSSASNDSYTLEVDSSSHTSNVTNGGAMSVDVNSGRAFTIDGNGNVIVGGSSVGASGSFSMEPNGHVRTVLASGTAGSTLFGAIYGVSNGFQIETDSSNNQTYKFYNGSTDNLTINSSGELIGTNSYRYVYPGNYADASKLARFMAPVNYASGVYWGGGNGTATSGAFDGGSDTNTGGNFTRNGTNTENNLGYADHPGLVPCSSVWRAQNNDSSSNDDGGWNKWIYNLPGDDWGYLSTVMVRRVGTDESGQFYHGCSHSHTLYQNGTAQTNPYFNVFDISLLPSNIWCLSIGVITGNGAGDNGDAGNNTMVGVFRLDTGQKIYNGDWFRMKDGETTQRHRVYLYYSTSSNAHLQFRQPGFYVMDGSEPSIAELSHGRLCFKAGTGIVPVEDA